MKNVSQKNVHNEEGEKQEKVVCELFRRKNIIQMWKNEGDD